MFQFLQRIKHRIISPKVYAIEYNVSGGRRGLCIGIAYSLEELLKEKGIAVGDVTLHVSISLEEIQNSVTQLYQKEDTQSSISQEMKEIIDKKDMKRFEKERSKFTEAEQKYILEQIT